MDRPFCPEHGHLRNRSPTKRRPSRDAAVTGACHASHMRKPGAEERIDPVGIIPFLMVHLAAVVGVAWVGFSWEGVALCLALYYLRMFGIAAGFHRYFSHRAFRTSRPFQFVLALLGTLAAQKGPLWWAAHHRNHHRFSDTDLDLHSPTRRGFWWSHVGWVLCKKNEGTDYAVIKDFARYPELRWLGKNYLVPPFALAILMYLVFGWVGLYW